MPASSRSTRIGIDVGGTFTDLVLVRPEAGTTVYFKEASTPHEPSLAVERGVQGILERAGAHRGEIELIVHGTTLGLNTIIQRRGARMALIVSRGHKDLLEFGRLLMPDSFDFFDLKEVPLVARDLVFEVSARTRADGTIESPVDRHEILRLADELRSRDIRSIALVLLNSYRHPDLELELGRLLRTAMPEALVTESCSVWPEMREYERGMVAALNAYIHPQLDRYFTTLQRRMVDIGVLAPIYITANNGGTIGIRTARERPIDTVLSGPASGVVASCRLAAACGVSQFVTFDMGGTSSDMAVTVGGRPEHSTQSMVGDFPLILPVINVSAIGAGGGSIVWVDAHGLLKVGPRSAGADPGPICYGRGGTEVTITDCYLTLGMLRADGFLGGKMHLDAPAAGRALTLLGARLGYMDADAAPRAAEAALRVATAKMATEVRGGFARRGLDPRDFALIAYGGAGPTHGALLAHEVGMPEMLVPLSPGTLCALGAVASELRRDFVRTIRKPVGAASTSDLQRAVASIRTESSGWLADERHLFGASIATHWTAEMRYPQEGIGLVVGLASEVLDTGDSEAMASAFHVEHERLYGFRDTSGGVELMSLHAQVVGGEPGSLVSGPGPGGTSTGSAQTGARRVFTGGTWETVAIHQRHALTAGTCIPGPALIEQEDTTVWILPGCVGVPEAGGIIRVRSAKP